MFQKLPTEDAFNRWFIINISIVSNKGPFVFTKMQKQTVLGNYLHVSMYGNCSKHLYI